MYSLSGKTVNSRNQGLVLTHRQDSYQELPVQVGVDQEAMAIKEYSAFSIAQILLVPHYQIVEYHIQDTRWSGGLTSLLRSSRYILQPQLTGQGERERKREK